MKLLQAIVFCTADRDSAWDFEEDRFLSIYFLTLILAAGFSLALGLICCLVGMRIKEQRHWILLAIIAVLESSYCLMMLPYLTAPIQTDQIWIGMISIFMCFTTYFYGELTLQILAFTKASKLKIFQKVNLSITSCFALGIIIDLFFGLETKLFFSHVQDNPTTLHLKLAKFTPLGESYLMFVNSAFSLFSFLLFKDYFSNKGSGNLPIISGVTLYFLTIANDFNIVFQVYDFYFLQHLGFLGAVLGFFLTFTKDYFEKNHRLAEALEHVERQKEALIESERFKVLGNSAAFIAHEIRNPLTILTGSTEILKKRLEKNGITDEKTLKMPEQIKNCGKRINNIVKGVSSFSRKQSLDQFETFKVTEFLDETHFFCQAKALEKNVKLQLECLQDGEMEAHRIMVSQVIINLVSNACDAICDQEKPWIKITAEVQQKTGWVEFRVIDSGNGLPEEFSRKILQPFFTTKKKGEGTGIGLTISKSIIEKHHGALEIDQDCPNTCFIVKFPLIQNPVSNDIETQKAA